MRDKIRIPGTIFITVFIIGFLFWITYQIGWLNGYKQREEDKRKWDCEMQFSLTPRNQIIGDCLKYFEKLK